MMFDINYGIYFYVILLFFIFGGVIIGVGIFFRKIDKGIGVMKVYIIRVGEGLFVIEIKGEFGDKIRGIGGEYGVVIGRLRRCGWFDLVVGRYVIEINGLIDIVMIKIDVLSGLGKLKICIVYEIDGVIYEYVFVDIKLLDRVIFIYEEFDGWDEDII